MTAPISLTLRKAHGHRPRHSRFCEGFSKHLVEIIKKKMPKLASEPLFGLFNFLP